MLDLRKHKKELEEECGVCVTNRDMFRWNQIFEPWFEAKIIISLDQVIDIIKKAARHLVEEGKEPYYAGKFIDTIGRMLATERAMRGDALEKKRSAYSDSEYCKASLWTPEEWEAYRVWVCQYIGYDITRKLWECYNDREDWPGLPKDIPQNPGELQEYLKNQPTQRDIVAPF
jgi:hypothetical protein